MPTIECWHVARWIALFESQITRRLPSTSSCGPPPSAVPKLPLFLPTARPSSSCSTSLSRRLSTSETSSVERKRKAPGSSRQHRQFATCLRSCLSFLSSLRRGVCVNDSRISAAILGRSDAISMTSDVQALIRGVHNGINYRSSKWIFIIRIMPHDFFNEKFSCISTLTRYIYVFIWLIVPSFRLSRLFILFINVMFGNKNNKMSFYHLEASKERFIIILNKR